MNRPVNPNSSLETAAKASVSFSSQLLATKFYVPVTSGTLIARPRLIALLEEGLKHPFTLVSAPAGFGKTTLLSTWAQSLSASTSRLCWVSLDEEDNDPQLFWTYVPTALDMQGSHRFEPLLMHLQSQPPPPLKSLLTALVNLLAESQDYFVLILDDYQLITQEQVHTTLAYLLERLPAQLRIVVSTRADPPLPLPLLRARQRTLEVRTEQLRCTVEETGTFLHQVMGLHLSEATIQEVTARTEGWLVGLQLLALSFQHSANPATLLQEASGDQRYILDYLTEVVLSQQPQEIQTFLLCTSLLEYLTASLCDAVLQQHNSQHLLRQLEQANLFVTSLDSRREWYRYHALFAEALHYQLEQTHADLLPILHHRASIWYAEHNQTTQAIQHAFKAREWQRTADLIEQKSHELMTFTWGAGGHKLALFREWLEGLPAEIVGSRPRFCLACIFMLWAVAPYTTLNTWFDIAEAGLAASLKIQTDAQERQEQEYLLGGVIFWRAFLLNLWEDHGQAALTICQQVLSQLSPDNIVTRVQMGWVQTMAYYMSSVNNAMRAIESGLQAGKLAQQVAGQAPLAIALMGTTAILMLGTGQLHEARRLTQQAITEGSEPGACMLPDVSYPMLFQAEVLREWNQLDTALSLIQEAVLLCEQSEAMGSLAWVTLGYGILLRVHLSRGELEAARSALQRFEHINNRLNQPIRLFFPSYFTTIDQVRLWLACGELDYAIRWAEELDLAQQHGTPFARERGEVARTRIFLAMGQAHAALQRLEPVLQRATTGQRWGHVIEIRLLQALAHQILQEEGQALQALSEAIRLAEPESYIRSFVDEGAPMEALLSRLREQQRKAGPTPYLDTLLAAFPQQSKAQERLPKRAEERTKTLPLLDPLSEREMQVLHLLAQGASNQEIAHELVIALNTVKRHVSHIFSKLGVHNRIQVIKQARELGLLNEEV